MLGERPVVPPLDTQGSTSYHSNKWSPKRLFSKKPYQAINLLKAPTSGRKKKKKKRNGNDPQVVSDIIDRRRAMETVYQFENNSTARSETLRQFMQSQQRRSKSHYVKAKRSSQSDETTTTSATSTTMGLSDDDDSSEQSSALSLDDDDAKGLVEPEQFAQNLKKVRQVLGVDEKTAWGMCIDYSKRYVRRSPSFKRGNEKSTLYTIRKTRKEHDDMGMTSSYSSSATTSSSYATPAKNGGDVYVRRRVPLRSPHRDAKKFNIERIGSLCTMMLNDAEVAKNADTSWKRDTNQTAGSSTAATRAHVLAVYPTGDETDTDTDNFDTSSDTEGESFVLYTEVSADPSDSPAWSVSSERAFSADSNGREEPSSEEKVRVLRNISNCVIKSDRIVVDCAKHCVFHGKDCLLFGVTNSHINGSGCKVQGDHNEVHGEGSMVFGSYNTIYADKDYYITGMWNQLDKTGERFCGTRQKDSVETSVSEPSSSSSSSSHPPE